MDCFDSVAPTDEELLAFALEDEALPEAKRLHLEQCSICQQRLAAYQEVNTGLISHLYRRFCPDGTQISLYCADLLPIDERMRIAAHILECPLCAIEVADARRFMREVPAIPAPVTTSPSPFVAVRRVIGSLVRQQAQLVTRSDVTIQDNAWPRQYHAETIDLSLHLSRASNGASMLLGILTSADENASVDAFEGANAELYPVPLAGANGDGDTSFQEPLLRTQVDDLGNIVFSSVPMGAYTLLVHLAELEFVIENITIEHK
jgi:hypothetical protein